MLDILEIAREEGIKEGIRKGKVLGLKEGEAIALRALQQGEALGMLKALQETTIDTLLETFPVIPSRVSKQIRGIDDLDVIKGLHRQAVKCTDLQKFEQLLQQAI